eukprot:12650681-Alexandrium_andersonii.AAC.1
MRARSLRRGCESNIECERPPARNKCRSISGHSMRLTGSGGFRSGLPTDLARSASLPRSPRAPPGPAPWNPKVLSGPSQPRRQGGVARWAVALFPPSGG